MTTPVPLPTSVAGTKAFLIFALVSFAVGLIGSVLIAVAVRKQWIRNTPTDAIVNRLFPATVVGTTPAGGA